MSYEITLGPFINYVDMQGVGSGGVSQMSMLQDELPNEGGKIPENLICPCPLDKYMQSTQNLEIFQKIGSIL